MPDWPSQQRRLEILSKITNKDKGTNGPRLCDVAAEVIDVSGAGIMLMSGDSLGASVCNTNDVSALVESLQLTLGEGPCIDAYQQNRPVLEPDLVDPVKVRWTAFSRPAVEAGVRAVFGFPLHRDDIRLGALNLYCDRPGALSDSQHTYALSVADVVTNVLLVSQRRALPGSLAPEIDVASESRWVVHQASGMVSVQLGVTVEEALVRLRAYSFSCGRLVSEVADDVVARRIRFDDHQGDDSQQDVGDTR